MINTIVSTPRSSHSSKECNAWMSSYNTNRHPLAITYALWVLRGNTGLGGWGSFWLANNEEVVAVVEEEVAAWVSELEM